MDTNSERMVMEIATACNQSYKRAFALGQKDAKRDVENIERALVYDMLIEAMKIENFTGTAQKYLEKIIEENLDKVKQNNEMMNKLKEEKEERENEERYNRI